MLTAFAIRPSRLLHRDKGEKAATSARSLKATVGWNICLYNQEQQKTLVEGYGQVTPKNVIQICFRHCLG